MKPLEVMVRGYILCIDRCRDGREGKQRQDDGKCDNLDHIVDGAFPASLSIHRARVNHRERSNLGCVSESANAKKSAKAIANLTIIVAKRQAN